MPRERNGSRFELSVHRKLGNSPSLSSHRFEGLLMTKYFLHAALVVLLTSPLAVHAADAQRQAEVAKLGADVMPFSLKATTHIFTKTAEGGVQRVVAKSAIDTKQVRLVREHLHDIQTQFLRGDFSGPSHIHGNEMPGLADLKSAKPGQI